MAPVRPYEVLRTTCYEKVRHTTVATCTELFRFGQFVVPLSHSLDRIYRNNLGIYSTFIHIRSRMSRGLVLSAALAVVAMSSSANAGVAMVQSEGLSKGEELINFAKTLVGDALDFVGDTAVNAVTKTKTAITKLSNNDKLADFMGSRGWEFDASDLVDKSLLEHLKDADSFDAAFAALEEVRVVS